MTFQKKLLVSLLRYNQEIQEICTQYKKTHVQNKMASQGISPFVHLELLLEDCLEVFYNILMVYYTRPPSVLPKVLLQT